MGPYDSCRLMHINLAGFVKKDKDGNNYFDFEELEQVAYENMRLCDDLVDLELEHVDAIIEHIKSTYTDDNRNELELWEKVRKTGASSRRAGCGATSLADACALVGLPMASKEGMAFIEKVFKTKMRGELRAQVDLAEERGTFTGYDFDKEFKYDENTHTYRGCNSFFDAICSNPDIMDIITFKRMLAFGRRNVSWSTMAPVGTGAIMHQGSSGVEPVFMPYYKRRKKCVSGEKPTFIDKEGIGFVEFPVVHKPLKEWIMEHGEGYNPELSFEEQFTDENAEKWVKLSPWSGSFAPELTPSEHVAIQAIVQAYTSHSISKTCNMPNKATEKETSDLYFEAWHSGCKGMTQFRDGCRDGVLVTNKKADNDCSCTAVLRHSVPKREKSLPCDIHRFKNGGDKWVACVGLYNGEPYEIFTGLAYKLNIPEHVTSGEVIKNKVTKEMVSPDTGKLIKKRVSRYDIKYHDSVDGKDHILEDVGGLFCSEYYGYGKLVSGLLRHGMPLEYVVSTLENISDMGHMTINSWNRGVTRTLKKYLKDGETGEMCPECGGKLIRENGCVHCQDCGWSKCG